MASLRTLFSISCVVLTACGSESGSDSRGSQSPKVEAAFSTLPLPRDAEFVSRASSADALEITLYTPADVPEVTEYYRKVLGSKNWRLVSDSKNADGSTVLYAEQNGPPLWVRIWKPSDRGGTMVQLTGAVVDKGSKPASGRDTSSKRSD
jgi:hypothetical protein